MALFEQVFEHDGSRSLVSDERGGAREEDLSEVEMRRYDDPVEVRRGMVPGVGGPVEGPEQFLWHGRLWKAYEVVSHWVETGPWWSSPQTAGVLGGEVGGRDAAGPGSGGGLATVHDLLAEREVWRVEAGRGMASGHGVFDLVLDWAQGSWLLTRCLD